MHCYQFLILLVTAIPAMAGDVVVFSNGVRTNRAEARSDARRLCTELRKVRPAQAMLCPDDTAPSVSGTAWEVSLAYNPSSSLAWDLLESYQQFCQSGQALTFRYLARLVTRVPVCIEQQFIAALPLLSETLVLDRRTLDDQLNLYRTSLSGGRSIVVVGHSQGNYFANKAYDELDAERRIGSSNFRLVAVATPVNRVAGGGGHVTQQGDIIELVPGHLSANTVNGKSCGILDAIECHRFAPEDGVPPENDFSYLGGDATRPKILNLVLGTSPWSLGTDMPTARLASSAGIAIVRGNVTVVGHHEGNPGSGQINEEYNPVTNTWQTKAPYPRGDGRQALNWNATVGDTIYFFGGANIFNNYHTQTVDSYNPVTNTWQLNLATYPQVVGNLATTSYNAQIYCFGGMPYNGAPYQAAYRYEPFTRTFTALANMPTGRSQARAFVRGNKIWVAGGYAFPYTVRPTIDIYDPAQNQWSPGPSLPRADQHPYWVGTLDDGQIYAVYAPAPALLPVTYQYREATRVWEAMAVSTLPQNAFGVVGIGGTLHLIGGGDPKVRTVQRFRAY